MKRALLLLLFIAASAHAQIGWTLEQCRKHFGAEFTPTDTDSYRFSDNMSYSHVDWSKFNEWRKIHKHDEVIPNSTLTTGADTHYFHVDSVFDVYLNFDPDGTVGAIQWVKRGNPFSEAECKQRLTEASRVNWKRVPNGRRTPEYDWQSVGRLNWIGFIGDNPIFRATENNTGQGTYYLTIWTD
jgi:hypothetical protein